MTVKQCFCDVIIGIMCLNVVITSYLMLHCFNLTVFVFYLKYVYSYILFMLKITKIAKVLLRNFQNVC